MKTPFRWNTRSNQNYPNPFNPSTTLEFSLKEKGVATLTVFDVLGRKVTELINEELNAGVHTFRFEASGLASGIYYYQLKSADFVSVKKMMLLK